MPLTLTQSPYTLCVSLLFLQTIRSRDWTLSHLTTFLSSHFVTCHMSLSHLFLTNSFACLALNKWKSCALLIARDSWFLALVFAVGVLQLGLTVAFYFYVSLTTMFLLRMLFPFSIVSNKTPQWIEVCGPLVTLVLADCNYGKGRSAKLPRVHHCVDNLVGNRSLYVVHSSSFVAVTRLENSSQVRYFWGTLYVRLFTW